MAFEMDTLIDIFSQSTDDELIQSLHTYNERINESFEMPKPFTVSIGSFEDCVASKTAIVRVLHSRGRIDSDGFKDWYLSVDPFLIPTIQT